MGVEDIVIEVAGKGFADFVVVVEIVIEIADIAVEIEILEIVFEDEEIVVEIEEMAVEIEEIVVHFLSGKGTILRDIPGIW